MSETGNHLKPLRLFDIGRASGFPLIEEEKKHLRECEECQRILDSRSLSASHRHGPRVETRRKNSNPILFVESDCP
jgi:hypothetical protein